MTTKTSGWARTALRQQIEIFGEDQVSLDSLWRSVDSPEGHDPGRWSVTATPLFAGFSAYLDRLQGNADRCGRSLTALVALERRIQRSVAHRRSDEP